MSVQERLQILREAQPNTWLVFSADEDRLIGTAPSFSEAATLAENSGEQDPILSLVPPSWSPTLM